MLLPSSRAPTIVHARSRNADELDVVLAIVALPPAAASWRRCRRPSRWRELHARAAARPGTVRSTLLGNRRHTLAILGYLKSDASAFERLSLAGRMLKEAGARNPQSVGLLGTGEQGFAKSALEALLAATLTRAFALPTFRAQERAERRIRRVVLLGSSGFDVHHELASARGTNLARWLTALPPNVLDAAGYREALIAPGARHWLGLRWLDESCAAPRRRPCLPRGGGRQRRRRRRHRAPALPPGAARERAAHPDVALVGKGILFDTGGVNLKTHRSMLDMHTDMAGSAVALATLIALAELRAPLAADAWLAITENRIGPHAYKPQEVVRAANGVTIQVIHTDAEGRMVLADTLALAGRTQPRFMLDFATLTGACVYALTERMSGVFTNRPALVPASSRAPAARAASACGTSRSRPTTTPTSRARSPTSCNAPSRARAITFSRRASCRASCPRTRPGRTSTCRPPRAAADSRTSRTDITGFGVRFALELLLRQDAVCTRWGRARVKHAASARAPMTGTCTCATVRRWPRCCRSPRRGSRARS